MTEIVFKPEPGAGVENRMSLYRAYVNRKPVGLLVRAKNAGAADRLVQHLFTTQTGGRTLVADENLMKEVENGETNGHEAAEDPQDGDAAHPADPGQAEAGA